MLFPILPLILQTPGIEDVFRLFLFHFLEAAQCLRYDFIPIHQAHLFQRLAEWLFFLHSVEGVAHDCDEHVQQHEWDSHSRENEDKLFQGRVRCSGEISKVDEEDMHKELRVGVALKLASGSGGREEQGDNQVGGQEEDEERSHVFDDFDDNAKENSSGLEKGEYREGLQTLEETQQSEEHGLHLLGRRVSDDGSPKVEDAKDEAE